MFVVKTTNGSKINVQRN